MRKPNQAIELTQGDKVIARVTVMAVRGNRVSIATSANSDIEILRTELKPQRTAKGLADRVKERKLSDDRK